MAAQGITYPGTQFLNICSQFFRFFFISDSDRCAKLMKQVGCTNPAPRKTDNNHILALHIHCRSSKSGKGRHYDRFLAGNFLTFFTIFTWPPFLFLWPFPADNRLPLLVLCRTILCLLSASPLLYAASTTGLSSAWLK